MRHLVLALVVLSRLLWPAPAGAGDAAQADVLFQVSTIDALLDGVYDGAMSMADLLAHGDTGIGTLDGLDGELIILDGRALVVGVDGVARPVPAEATTPFAAVTVFQADRTVDLGPVASLARLAEALDAALPTQNLFYALKARGRFDTVTVRSVPRQSRPYPPLAEVTAHQAVFRLRNVSGTLVGLRCPPFVKGVNVPGWHLHFITDDLARGGHVLDLSASSLAAGLDETPGFAMALPPMGSDFYRSDLSLDRAKALRAVEQ